MLMGKRVPVVYRRFHFYFKVYCNKTEEARIAPTTPESTHVNVDVRPEVVFCAFPVSLYGHFQSFCMGISSHTVYGDSQPPSVTLYNGTSQWDSGVYQ